MHPRCGRSLKQTSPGKILRYCRVRRIYICAKPIRVRNILYTVVIIIIMIAISLIFEKSLSPNMRNSYDPTFVIELFATNSAQPRRCYFTGTVWRYTLSNSANLGVRRMQETALPMDRVVFIMNASKKNHPLAPAVTGHRRR